MLTAVADANDPAVRANMFMILAPGGGPCVSESLQSSTPRARDTSLPPFALVEHLWSTAHDISHQQQEVALPEAHCLPGSM